MEVFNLSFLDVVSCGFGAIILLLVITKVNEPAMRENIRHDLSGTLTTLEQELVVVRTSSQQANGQLNHWQEQILAAGEEEARLRQKLAAVAGQAAGDAVNVEALVRIEQQLHQAKQELSDEMRRLQQQELIAPPEGAIGGVPVDSEYIIFIIDTSGSMQRFAWPLLRRKMAEILNIYPRVRGIQVMNDMGEYMFSQYAGKWIPDSPSRRKSILRRLSSWAPFSNSSPVEGITSAIRRFYSRDKKISLYVLGDDFSRGSIQEVVDTVDAINRGRNRNERRVRIHAVGFPVLFSQANAEANLARFAALMRRLAEDNNGSFVGLNSLQ